MSLMTNWGYSLPDTDTLPNLLTTTDFNALTAGKYAGDARAEPDIASASAAVRNYCGWHVLPSLPCVLKERLLYGNGRIKRVYDDFVIQLPAAYVSEVTGIKINGEAFDDFALEGSLVYLFGVPLGKVNRRTEIEVEYIAGISDELAAGIRELMAHRVTHALASSDGVQSESAGGVSITYASGWTNSGGAAALADTNKEVLEPYRVQGVF